MPNAPPPIKVFPFIWNIAVSNHDHATNALDFLNDGRLIFTSGSNTNAGLPAQQFGALPVCHHSMVLPVCAHINV